MPEAIPTRQTTGTSSESLVPEPSGPAPAPDSRPGRRARFLRLLGLMGPAFVVGAWQFGPGNLTSAVQAGSRFGYSLIWVIAVSTALMIMFTDMSVRIAIVSRGSVVETVKHTLGRATGGVAGLGVFAITLMFAVGNAVGSGLGLSLVLGGSPVWWTLACTAVVATVLFARQLYGVVEKVLLAIVATMAVSFVVTAVLSRPSWTGAAAGLLPTIPPGTGLLLVALVGTNFSINAAFYTGYASRERGLRRDQYRGTTLVDTVPGIVAPGIMTALVIIASAAVLGGKGGGQGASLAQLAGVLEPIAGDTGRIIFALGFFGAAFSSMIANATAGGTLLSDGLGWGNQLSSVRVRLGIVGVLAFGAIVTAVAGGSPVELIIVAQALTVVVAPLLGVLLVILANNRRLMGDLRNRSWQNAIALVGLIAILATCYRLITSL